MIIEVSLNIDTSLYSVVVNDYVMTTTKSADEAKLYGNALKLLRDRELKKDISDVRHFLFLINKEFTPYEFGRWITGMFFKHAFGAKVDCAVAPFEGEEYIVVNVFIPKGKDHLATDLYHPVKLERLVKTMEGSEESES